MIINHNMASLNTYRQLSNNNANSSRSLEKLSSGLRINKAGDDAAGLAISEKMRGQIRGLDQASRNAQDSISMLNTAEGSLSETHSILQRMKELATQAGNDTNVGVDRNEIQKEINQLTSEINRIGNTTEFNTQKLLNGGDVDPTTKTVVSGLDVPTSFSSGQGTGATTDLVKTFTVGTQFAAADDGKTISFTFGDKTVNLQLNSNLTMAASTETQIGISDVASAANSATAIRNALVKAFADDNYLSDNFTLGAIAGDGFAVTAKTLAYSNGKLAGTEDGMNGNISILTDTTLNVTEAVTTPASGSQASAVIDFTGKSVSDVAGTGFAITNTAGQVFNVNLYDSSNGEYTGLEDSTHIAVDLKGAGNAEAIVDKIVTALNDTDGSTKVVLGAADTAYATKTDTSKLLLTAADVAGSQGAAGNSLKLDYVAERAVSDFVGSDKLSGEAVTSASGLADGQHTVKVTYNAASTVVGFDDTANAGTMGVTVGTTTNFDSGTYRIIDNASGADDHVSLQKLGSDGTWSTLTGYEDITLGVGANTIGDVTITGYAASDITNGSGDQLQFTINKQNYSVALQEADSASYGPAVVVNSGEQNVTLQAIDGVGQATINIGDISSSLNIGANTTFNFSTSAASESTSVIGGKFEATFQIGANMGQSMSIEINDMRSQALQVAGTSAGGKASVEGAVFTATKDVTNGTDNNNVEYALDVSDHTKATAAIKVLSNAIETVSAERSKLGAYTNRLDHTITNLGTSSENMTAAESRIRDVDMAKEMMQFQKNNILSQAAQAMLAQANQQPQGVLQLLR